MRRFDTAERRRRLGVRHALAAPVGTPEEVTAAVTALHSTDPASMMLSVLARMAEPSVSEVERALYDDRTLVRLLVMRRTVFAVPVADAGAYLGATRQSVAESEYRKLVALVAGSALAAPEQWLERAHASALAAVDRLGVFSSADLAASDPLLATRIEISAGTRYATRQSIASRLLTVMSAQGHVVRARPAGTWASTQFRWSSMRHWLPQLTDVPDAEEARALVARRWLARFGPARPEDLKWWTGWTKGHTIAALARLETAEVELDDGTGLVLADDLDPTPEPEPWVALLPALDPTTMGWKHRDWYLGPHADQVFDTNGNAGPTVWKDGQIVGGWAIRDDGTVAVRLLTDVGAEAAAAIEARAHDLETQLAGTVIKARARGWSPVERDLRD
ncbi:winged helix DNA-binding domain-containing protein [Aeromicrobium sp. 636]|uniref:AlkZ family DNA glycosylase n=1 Tax=Aeromicrobium senzhongii TaxID=2663859 RepID=A0A8I0K0S3_9ACTN|nr:MULTISPECIES: winged helix DNA-binding domain-containing protein [Aeromicrobium]MBC9227347.1 AlkZ family DNA glycosylase [Aeromicrobium senzhongii]MCQ3999445.1 winged helix DNA-binding domain-containing protein [Aeromicrobium sp. 636]